jgi:hypothetical protein
MKHMGNRLDLGVGPGPTSCDESTSHRQRVWAAGAALLIALGVTGSVLGAGAISHTDAQQANSSFGASSAEIASTLQLAIQHEQDLVVSAAAFVIGNPDGTETEFVRWADSA